MITVKSSNTNSKPKNNSYLAKVENKSQSPQEVKMTSPVTTRNVSSAPSKQPVKAAGVWVAKPSFVPASHEKPVASVTTAPLGHRHLNTPKDAVKVQHAPAKDPAKLKIENRRVSHIQTPESKAKPEPKASEPAPQETRGFASLLRKPANEKIDQDLEYFKSLEKNREIQNLCRDKKTSRVYSYTIANDDKIFKQQLKLSNIYSKQGLFVPEHKILNTAEGEYVLLVQGVVGKKPSEYLKGATPDQVTKFNAQLSIAFAIDILFMNLNVLQGNLDSDYLVNDKGNLCRISVSSLNTFGPDVAYPTEIWDMRDPNKNPASKIWSTLNIVAIAKQIVKLIKADDSFFYELPKAQKDIADKRLKNLLIIANKTLSMSQDGWHTSYIEKLNYHMVCLKKAGCEHRLPTWLHPDASKDDPACRLRGPGGITFEGLRHKNSVVETLLMPYVAKNGGNYQFIIDWMVGHESSGWSNMSQVLMHFLTLHRNAPKLGHFWKEGMDVAINNYNQCALKEGRGDAHRGQVIIENSFIMLHAFTQIVLGHTAFPNNNLINNAEGTVRFLRSESKHVMYDYVRVGDYEDNINMKMASYSSGSVVTNPPLVHGTEVTERTIPHHRVIATYFMMRSLSAVDRGAFSNDFQNEFTAILGGINCNYIDSLKK